MVCKQCDQEVDLLVNEQCVVCLSSEVVSLRARVKELEAAAGVAGASDVKAFLVEFKNMEAGTDRLYIGEHDPKELKRQVEATYSHWPEVPAISVRHVESAEIILWGGLNKSFADGEVVA